MSNIKQDNTCKNCNIKTSKTFSVNLHPTLVCSQLCANELYHSNNPSISTHGSKEGFTKFFDEYLRDLNSNTDVKIKLTVEKDDEKYKLLAKWNGNTWDYDTIAPKKHEITKFLNTNINTRFFYIPKKMEHYFKRTEKMPRFKFIKYMMGGIALRTTLIYPDGVVFKDRLVNGINGELLINNSDLWRMYNDIKNAKELPDNTCVNFSDHRQTGCSMNFLGIVFINDVTKHVSMRSVSDETRNIIYNL